MEVSRHLLLDTNAYTDFHRESKWLAAIENSITVSLPLIVIGELRFGFVDGNQPERNERTLEQFLAKPSASVVAPDLGTTRFCSLLCTQLKRQGTPIPQNDLWIAALALQHGLWLCTSDAYFDHLPQLLRATP